jgi:uncharacterized protein (TIGR00725 family)
VAGAVYVGVIGSSVADSDLEALAEGVGRELAEAGAIVVCGGLGGVMAAASRGASEGGGVTIGLLPGTDRAEGNEWLSIALPTGLGELRNGLIVRAADVLIAVGGEWGTLSEIALAVRASKTVVGLGRLPVGPDRADAIVSASDPRDAVEKALAVVAA